MFRESGKSDISALSPLISILSCLYPLYTDVYYLFGTVLSTETDIRITDVAGRPAGCIITEMGNDNVKNIYLYMYTDDLSDFEFLIINGEKVPVFKS